MRISRRDQEDYDYLTATAEEARVRGVDQFVHLDQPIGRWNYIRIANEIAGGIPAGKLLDWGCGFGQMTYLLRRRGFEVTPFDIGADDALRADIPLCRDVQVVRTTHPTQLPFGTQSYDIVLSCGVLEHVDEHSQQGNELESLREIRRVLRPGGYFLVYQLPQRWAWQEALMRRLRLGYWHPRRYSEREINGLLAQQGYRIERLRRYNLLPKNLTGVPEPVRAFYSRFSRALLGLDAALCHIPFLNRLAGVMEIVARPEQG